MAVQFGRRSILRPWLLVAMLWATIATPTMAQICTFWDTGCVDPLAQTAVAFHFPPLFLNHLTLYYGFDANSRGKGKGPMTKTGFWLDYGANHLNDSVITANRTSEIAFRVGNLTGTPSGSNNGCDGVLGSQCTYNLKELFKGAIYDLAISGRYYQNPLATVINQMLVTTPVFSNCPPAFFEVQSIPVEGFVWETETTEAATLTPSGCSDNPWKTWFIDDMSSDQQAAQVAVAIISRAPMFNNSYPQYSKDDIDIELVCIQAPSPGGPPLHGAGP